MSEATKKSPESLGIDASRMPRHIAIIMDGNGRWAREQGLPRVRGHQQGATAVREIVTECARLGVEVLTLYSFSNENWKRPQAEVDFLMGLYGHYLVAERGEIVDNNIRLVHVGRREGLPEDVLREMDTTITASKDNTGMRLCLALNYGARTELIDAVQRIAKGVADGVIAPADIDESTIADALYTAGLPDPDLLIRTAGERRISNFLLWQISYAELFVCPAYWPDFSVEHLHDAIRDYASRDRRFGAL
ncbi:MAG: isoprenyl transferase [Phycisphaerales bacterium]|nr:isoprenyl transferase [Phycisphaerales bacterium]